MTVLPSAGESPTGRANEFEAAYSAGMDAAAKAAAEAAAKEPTEAAPTLSSILSELRDIVAEPETPAASPAEPEPGTKPAEPKPEEKPEAARKSEVDALMEKLADEPKSIQEAVRRALESGMEAKAAVDAVLAERDSVIANAQLVSEVDQLAKKYPSFSPEQLTKTLDHLSKLPVALADELSLEEVARRAIGDDALQEARKTPAPPAKETAPKKGAIPSPGARLPAAAEIVGDATPGAPMEGKPFDPGKGNNFNDLASFIVKKHGDSLMLPRK